MLKKVAEQVGGSQRLGIWEDNHIRNGHSALCRRRFIGGYISLQCKEQDMPMSCFKPNCHLASRAILSGKLLSKFESAKKSLFQSVNGTLAVKQRLSLSNQRLSL